MTIATKLVLVNFIIFVTIIVIDMIACKGDTKKTIFGDWIYTYTNLSLISIPGYIVYLIWTW